MISILIPIYNGIEFLDKCLKTVKYQTFEDWEVIIGVNGHPENSKVFIEANKHSDIKIKVYDLHTLKGKTNALNKMLEFCSYNWVAILDVDDYWLPSKLQEQLPYLEKYDVIGTLCKYFGDSNAIPSIPVNDISNFNFLHVNPLINSSCLIRKELCFWKNDKGLDDYELWLELRKQNKRFFNVPKILTMHMIHKNSAFNAKGNNNYVEELRKRYMEN